MASKITVRHIVDLVGNLKEVKTLLDIHLKLTGNKRGNRSSVNVLNKSGIVLVVACWEAFVEDVARAAFEHMIDNANTPDVFTRKVQVLASEGLYSAEDKSKIWSLAGDGWKQVLKNHRDEILADYLGDFNTAKAKPINGLFKNLIGVKSLTKDWHWQGTSETSACARLDALVALRGDIAHRVKSDKTVLKSDVEDAIDFVQNLAVITSNRVAIYVRLKTKSLPWKGVKYGNRI